MTKYAIRRDLKKGKTFGFLQVRECITNSKLGKEIALIDGKKYSLIMKECFLYNSLGTSTKIFEGRNLPKQVYKKPCAWIVCNSFEVVDTLKPTLNEVTFNPRISPNFMLNDTNVNKTNHNILISSGCRIYK